MYRDHRTYIDFNGVERTEDFYFNLSKAEIADMELSTTGGIKDMVNKILEAKDQAKLVSLFKDLIRMAYGVKSEDGRNFIKNDKVREDYFSTNAYSDLYMELATNDQFASQFFEAILPVTATDSEPNTDNVKELPN
nr:MAG TPA: hypothetical protein [Caudoviricetes sp.]